MEWNKEKTLLLIQEFYQRPGLWNMTHEDYRKKETKRNLLEQIAAKFDSSLTASDIERKFHTLRTQYHREINRMYTSQGAEYKSKWFAFPHLQFLNDPNACRNTKDGRRRTTTGQGKVIYLSNTNCKSEIASEISIANTSATNIHAKKLETADKEQNDNSRNFRKDLRELFEETVDSEDGKNDEEQETAQAIEYMQPNQPLDQTNVHHGCYEEDHLVETQEQSENVAVADEETEQYQQHIEHQPVKIIKTDHYNFDIKQTQDYPQFVYEAVQTPVTTPAPKRICKDAATLTAAPASSARDDCTVFGECVANELRFITDRQILVTVKHKINNALFEASVAQLEKNGCG